MGRKDRMGSLEQEGKTLTCSCGKMWPPILIVIYETPQEARPYATELEYEGIRVWSQACGLMKMDPLKCPSCPYVKVDGELASLKKKPRIHATSATRIATANKKLYERKHGPKR